MPYHDEEYPGQPLWQSVLLFCCKGMIEGIVVVLFLWLLVQVLFTKQLEVHLQILLLVGLIVLCLSLVLGCILCWRDHRIFTAKPASPAPAEAETFAEASLPSVAMTVSRQQNQQLDGDVLDFTTIFTSPVISDGEFSSRAFLNQENANEQKELQKSYFSLRRLSSSRQTSPLYKPIDSSHSSMSSFPKLSLLARTCKALQRRCTVDGDRASYDEHSRLTSPSAVHDHEKPIPLAPLSYGSGASCQLPVSTKPCLHFKMTFSSEQQTLALTIVGFTGMTQNLQDVYVLGSLPPLHPRPVHASVQNRLDPEAQSLVLLLTVSSVKELQRCVLRLAVYARESQSQRSISLGEVEDDCGQRDWRPDIPLYTTKELKMERGNVEKVLISQDALIGKRLSCPPQIFILLHYQTPEHCIKATVLRAENLSCLAPTSVSADYQVVVNLHHDGVLISSRETPRESCTAWNTSFLFDLPVGDISRLTLMLEFEVVQLSVSEGQVIGRVLIGAEAADAGRAHWRDMYTLLMEQARWHIVHPELL